MVRWCGEQKPGGEVAYAGKVRKYSRQPVNLTVIREETWSREEWRFCEGQLPVSPSLFEVLLLILCLSHTHTRRNKKGQKGRKMAKAGKRIWGGQV